MGIAFFQKAKQGINVVLAPIQRLRRNGIPQIAGFRGKVQTLGKCENRAEKKYDKKQFHFSSESEYSRSKQVFNSQKHLFEFLNFYFPELNPLPFCLKSDVTFCQWFSINF